ncbi:hypothetical protein [Candidatus Phytoplasma australasiaticum]|uniref:hypothetical protein n=1 Tax=Candidatus Phytoplasma australasiaticum TaxID=2754999 RepID=UPI0027132E7F|nr:hypothetical protein [Candidatus Phytoplasma australasiaticum]MDO8031074.1 hypothetical protein [Candidatus Phytoplasma australasiaticum]MDV3171753.1 hypothetical protein [Candidatus Phytoplasma australasiaticum]
MHRKKFKNNNFNSLNNSLEPNYDPMVKCLINNIIILCHEIQQINLFNDNYMKDFLIFLPIYSAVPHTNLTPQFASNIPQLNIDYHYNVDNLKQQLSKKLENSRIITNNKEISLNQEFKKRKQQSILQKCNIITEYNINKDKLNDKYKMAFQKLNLLENELQQQQIEQNNLFTEKYSQFNQKYHKNISDIYDFFHQKIIILNQKIKQLKDILNYSIENMKNFYQNQIQHLQEENFQKNNYFSEEIKNYFNLLQKKIEMHNNIFDQFKSEFNKKYEIILQKRQKIWEEYLRGFFFITPMFSNSYSIMKNLMRDFFIYQKMYLMRLYDWRFQYMKFKFIYNCKLNIVEYNRQIFNKINNFKIDNLNLIKNKEQKLIHNNYLQKIDNLEMELTLLKIKKKYGLIQEEIIDEKNKQRLSYENLQKKFILIEKLNDIQYQKDILELQKQNQKRKCLLKMQLQMKKIPLKMKYDHEIFKNFQEIQKLKEQLYNLHYHKEYEINLKNIIYEQKKQNYLYKIEIPKIKIQDIIAKNNFIKQKNLINITLFNNYLNKQNQTHLKVLQKIKEQLNIFQSFYFEKINNDFTVINLQFIYQLNKIFVNKIIDEHFKYLYILKINLLNLKINRIKQKINLNQVILNFYNQNISFISVLMHKMKLKNLDKNTNFLVFFEKKMKIYETIGNFFKKKMKYLEYQQNKQQQLKKHITSQLKKQQNCFIQTNNLLQYQIFQLTCKLNSFSNTKFGYRILYSFYLNKIKNKWLSYYNHLELPRSFFVREYDVINSEISHIKKIQSDEDYFLLQEGEYIIDRISKVFFDITQVIRDDSLQDIIIKYQKQEKQIRNEINLYEKQNKSKLKEMKWQIDLIQDNLKDSLADIDKDFIIQKNKIKKKYDDKNKKINYECKNQLDLYQKHLKDQNYHSNLLKTQQQSERNKILFNHWCQNKEIIESNNQLLNQINRIKIYQKMQIQKILFFQKIRLIFLKILWWYKFYKNKQVLKTDYKKNLIILKQKMLIKFMRLYKKLIKIFGI